jgi:hypothetical protein
MKFAAAKLRTCECANQLNRIFLHLEPHLFKNRNNTTVDFKNLKSVAIPYFRPNQSFKGIILGVFI